MATEIRPMVAGDAEELAHLWVRTWQALQRSLALAQRGEWSAGGAYLPSGAFG